MPAPKQGGADIDKVRDILFGNQMREVERRFARLEERLIKETIDLKEDLEAARRAGDVTPRRKTKRWPTDQAEHDGPCRCHTTLARAEGDGEGARHADDRARRAAGRRASASSVSRCSSSTSG